MWGLAKLKLYLLVIQTDHNPLVFLNYSKSNQRVLRWALQLADFDFEIQHIPGQQNKLADVLSRMYSKE